MRARDALGWGLAYVRRPRWDNEEIHDVLARWIADAPGRGARAIDLGCGTGPYTRLLAKAGYEALGVDLSISALARARWRARGSSARFLFADVADLRPSEVGRFELLLDVGCLHSLPADSRAAYLAGVANVARPSAEWLLLAVEPGIVDDIPGVDPEEPARWPEWERVEIVRTDAGPRWGWPISITRLRRR